MRPLSLSVGAVTAPGHHQLAMHSEKEASLHTCADAVGLWMEQSTDSGISQRALLLGACTSRGRGSESAPSPSHPHLVLVARIPLPCPEQLGVSPGVISMRPGHGTPRLTTLPFGPGWPSIPVTPWMNDIETKETEN